MNANVPVLRCTTCDEVVVEPVAGRPPSGLEIAVREAVHHCERHGDDEAPGQRPSDRAQQPTR